MGTSIRIDASELIRFARELGDEGVDIAGQEIGRAMDTVGALIQRAAAMGAPDGVSKDLRNSILRSTSGSGLGRVVEVGTPVEYAVPVEFGVRPGAHPGLSRNGYEAVVLWFRRKLGLSQDDAESAAALFGMAIKRRGIPAHPFMAPAVDDNLAEIGATFDRAADRAVARMSKLGRP